MQVAHESLTEADAIVSVDEELLLHKYFEENFAFQPLLDSYNYSYDYEFEKCLNDKAIKLSGGRYAKCKFIGIEKPTQSHEAALLTDSTYAGGMIVKMCIYNAADKLLAMGDETTLWRPPIPVRSKYCLSPLTHPKDPNVIKDPGCYFVVNGIRRIVILYEKLRQNQFCLNKDTKTGEYSVRQLTEVPSGGIKGSTSQSTITMSADKTKNGSAFDPIAMTNFDKKTIDKSVDKGEYIGDTRFNVLEMVYVAYYFLENRPVLKGRKAPKRTKADIAAEFEKLIVDIVPREHLSDCLAAFAPTLVKFENTDLKTVIDKMNLAIKGESADKKEEIRRIISGGLHPNHRNLKDKIVMVITMTSRLLQCYTGKIPIYNRNAWPHKGRYGPGSAIIDLFRRKYSGAIIKMSKGNTLISAVEPADVMNLLLNSDLESKFMAEFNNNPGGSKKFFTGAATKQTGGNKTPKPITQDLYPNNTFDFWLNLLKTKSSVGKHSKDKAARSLDPSSLGTTCNQGVTDNENCGIIKFDAALSQLTIPTDPKLCISVLKHRKFTTDNKTIVRTKKTLEYDFPTFVNGLLIGYTNSTHGANNCRMLKRYGIIDRRCCIVPIKAGVLDIYTDGHRVVRPTLVTGDDFRPRIYSKLPVDSWKNMSFTQMVREGYIEYLDTYEFENPKIRIAETFGSFSMQERQIQDLHRMIDYAQVKSDTIRTDNLIAQLSYAEKYRISHADLHPARGYSIIVGILTYINHQQACRTAFDMKLVTQIIQRFLGSSHNLTNGLRSVYDFTRMLDSSVSRAVGLQDVQGGEPAIIAFIPMERNQEDAAILNQGAIDRGLLRFQNDRIFKETRDSAEQRFGRYIPPNKHPLQFRHINSNGLPTIGAVLRPEDCVIGKYEIQTSDAGVEYKKDRSTYLDFDQTGTVKEVIAYTNTRSNKNQEKTECIKVRVSSYDRIEEGSKVSLYHAQKFVVGDIVSEVDMPWVPHSYFDSTGKLQSKEIRLTAIFNPLCYITRMTGGTLAGPLAMKAYAGSGRIYNAGAHQRHNYVELSNMLLANGWSRTGTDICYNGITGEEIVCPIMVGPSHLATLLHNVKDKMQCHSIGAMGQNTRQAQASRKGISKDKGQKFSEYERVAALKSGAHFIIDERMNTASDAHTIVVCRSCSNYAVFDPVARQFVCKECGSEKRDMPQGKTFGKYMMPYSSRYEQALLLSTAGIDLATKYVGRDEYLRGTNLPSTEIGDADEGHFDDESSANDNSEVSQEPDQYEEPDYE